MPTDKKHIAVYLDPAVEAALVAFCDQKGLKSKKGTMYSAGVNAALAQFFGIVDEEVSNTPLATGNIPNNASNIPSSQPSIIPNNIGNILGNTPSEILAVEVMPGESEAGDSEELLKVSSEAETEHLEFLKRLLAKKSPLISSDLWQEIERLKERNRLLNIKSREERQKLQEELNLLKYRDESQSRRLAEKQARLDELETQLEAERASREEIEAELFALKQTSATASKAFPDPGDLLNQLKAKRKKSKCDLADVETILDMLGSLSP